MKRLLLTIAFLLIAAPLMAQITFQWDLSADDALLGTTGGYKLYQSRTSGSYGTTAVAQVLRGINTVTIAKPGLGRYYWVATAFSADGSESDYSNEVTVVIKPAKPTNFRITLLQAFAWPFKALGRMAKGKENLRIVEEE